MADLSAVCVFCLVSIFTQLLEGFDIPDVYADSVFQQKVCYFNFNFYFGNTANHIPLDIYKRN